jgi:hypothetical protein
MSSRLALAHGGLVPQFEKAGTDQGFDVGLPGVELVEVICLLALGEGLSTLIVFSSASGGVLTRKVLGFFLLGLDDFFLLGLGDFFAI